MLDMNGTQLVQLIVGLIVILVALDTVPQIGGWLLLLVVLGLLVLHSREIPA